MSLETILGIIFFVVFFILPALAKKKQPPEGEAPPERSGRDAADAAPQRQASPPAAGSAQPTRASTAAQSTQAPAGTAPRSSRGAGPLTAGSIEDALEEIRARVREAQEQEGAGRTSRKRLAAAPARAQTTPDGAGQGTSPRSGSLVSGEVRRMAETGSRPPGPGLGRQGGAAASGHPSAQSAVGSLGREGVAAPLEVTRRQRQPGRRTGSAPVEATPTAKRAQGALPQTAAAAATLSAPVLATDRASLVEGMIWHVILSEPAALRRLRRTRSRHQ